MAPDPRTWKLAEVTRSDAGGSLYNAVRTDNGHECPMEPSHNPDVIARRVEMLNRVSDRVRKARAIRATVEADIGRVED